MTFTTRTARALAAACLVVATLLAVAPGPAAALEPPRPLPGYRPAFVTETDTHPWIDCLWASGAMLLDKWTNGSVQVSRQKLRKLSGDRHGGSSFDEMEISFDKLGFNLSYSPDGGARITWRQLLKRLSKGAGAVLLGDDSKLPRHFGRWDYGFWKESGKKDNHAVYVERYDRRHGRVWLMDPLARGGWKGEWISVRALHRFVWKRGSAVYAAVTPVAKAAPFAGVQVARPEVTITPSTLAVSWGLKAPRRWTFPGVNIRASFQRAPEPLMSAIVAASVPTRLVKADAPARPTVGLVGKTLRATAALPVAAGAWLPTVSLTDRRFGRVVARSSNVVLFIPGTRRATLHMDVLDPGAEAGSAVPLSLTVANTGTVAWADGVRRVDVPTPAAERDTRLVARSPAPAAKRDTRLVARWIPLKVAGIEAGPGSTGAPDPIEIRKLPLAPGNMVRVTDTIVAPDQPGSWGLALDVVDNVDGSFAALGSEPAVQVYDIVTPRAINPLD